MTAEKSVRTATRVAFLAAIGLAVSAYLLYHHVSVQYGYQTGPSICDLGGSFNCDRVAKSEYSFFFGVPVATYGLFYFFAVFLSATLLRSNTDGHRVALFWLASIGLVPVLYLLYVTAIHIGSYCIFCMLTYLVVLLLAIVTFRDLPSSGRHSPTSLLKMVTARESRVFGFWALLAGMVVLLAVTPSMLITHVFAARQSDASAEPVFEAWKASPLLSMPVDQSTDLVSRDFSFGPADARITIVEFSDFQCPHCKRASFYLKALVEAFPRDLRVVFKNYPLDASCNHNVGGGMHEFACQAAVLARCAGREGDESFWKMHDALFDLESFDWSFEMLLSLPEQLQLNTEGIDACLNDPETVARVKADIAAGDAVGVQGTPALFLNGKRVTFDSFDQLKPLVRMVLTREVD